MNENQKKHVHGGHRKVIFSIACIDFVVTGIIALVIYVKYLFRTYPEGFAFAVFLKIHIWLLMWLLLFLFLFFLTGGATWYLLSRKDQDKKSI